MRSEATSIRRSPATGAWRARMSKLSSSIRSRASSIARSPLMTSSAADSVGLEQCLGRLRERGAHAAGHLDELGEDAVELLLILDRACDDRRDRRVTMGDGDVNGA